MKKKSKKWPQAFFLPVDLFSVSPFSFSKLQPFSSTRHFSFSGHWWSFMAEPSSFQCCWMLIATTIASFPAHPWPSTIGPLPKLLATTIVPLVYHLFCATTCTTTYDHHFATLWPSHYQHAAPPTWLFQHLPCSTGAMSTPTTCQVPSHHFWAHCHIAIFYCDDWQAINFFVVISWCQHYISSSTCPSSSFLTYCQFFGRNLSIQRSFFDRKEVLEI